MGEAQAGTSHRLVAFLQALGRQPDTASVLRTAVELVAEEHDAEVGAVVMGGQLRAAIGFGRDEAPAAVLEAIPAGVHTADLPGLGRCHTVAAGWSVGASGRLIVARLADPFTAEDRNLMLGMAGALGLAYDMVAAIERERRRKSLLEVLLGIQRSISRRAPLAEILTAVTDGTSTVLGGRPVSLVLDDDQDPDLPIVAGATLRSGADAVRAAVHVNGVRAGALVVSQAGSAHLDADEVELLETFAEHASLALTDAHAVEALKEAYRDALTGLPNRALFLDRLRHALRSRSAERGETAVLFIDLDRFKAVNDGLGHAAGDELLRAVARRITDSTRAGDTAARFGGDEFAVLLATDGEPRSARLIAQRIIAAMHEPFVIRGKELRIGTTIGIAHAGGGTDADELLGNADLAMYAAKADGRDRARSYSPDLRAALVKRLEVEEDLREALHRGELEVHFQPVVDLLDGHPVSMEALARWTHPVKGPISPGEFIPVAEAAGLIPELGRWVLDEACRRLAVWRESDPDLTVNVNVSVHQLHEPRFTEDVRSVLAANGLPGEALTLEITESVLMSEHGPSIALLQELKALGVCIALDDFGTGYSSLRYLQHLRVDALKIDRSFVAGPADDPLLATIVELGRSFGLRTVAEGVETAAEHARVRDLGCTCGQGWEYARPMAGDAVPAYLADAGRAALAEAA